MKIIFLDIDGVLCTGRAHYSQGQGNGNHGFMDAIDREGVGMLNKIAEDFDATFVISSTWRQMHTKESLTAHLEKYGFLGKIEEDWATPVGGRNRGAEIDEWMERNGPQNIEAYVIIDDVQQFMTWHTDHVVLTDASNGITLKNYYDIRTILGEKAYL